MELLKEAATYHGVSAVLCDGLSLVEQLVLEWALVALIAARGWVKTSRLVVVDGGSG